jgi:hypothetical protein
MAVAAMHMQRQCGLIMELSGRMPDVPAFGDAEKTVTLMNDQRIYAAKITRACACTS